MIGTRGSGILLHVTSLPSDNGIGNMGPGARTFVDFLSDAGQSYWQVLPLNPPSPGEGNSPYSSSSAFAGNIYLISSEYLVRDGFISQGDIPDSGRSSPEKVDYAYAIDFKEKILEKAYAKFKSGHGRHGFDQFCEQSRHWLDDFAIFKALKVRFENISWSDWPTEIRDRNDNALGKYGSELADQIEREKFYQFLFYNQWNELKKYANSSGVEIIGDIPIYMSHESSDVWSHPEIFKLDDNKKPRFIAGVPPDYFSKTGQLWGNPVYDWHKLEETGFDWWVKRVDHNLNLYNILRIDHFRGLAAYWEVPAGEKTAVNGKWVPVPGDRYFIRLRELYPSLPIIAEDLGTITDDVREFIARLDIPGMKVLLFAFGDSLPENLYAPHNHVKNCVIYTGTHDNNTIRGWFEEEASRAEKESLAKYVGLDVTPENVHEILVRLALMSVADIALIPMQDILGLPASCRMNTPSTTENNWEWRVTEEALSPETAHKLRSMTHIYGRLK